MIIKKNIIVEGKHTKPIVTDVFYSDTHEAKPIIIFCHGYKGFKDWGAWDMVAKTFADAGFFFIKFNFSHNGGTAINPIDFPDLDAFGNNNYTIELDDLASILDWVTDEFYLYKNQVDSSNICVIGHSRGGGIATIKTAEDLRVKKLVTWASVSDYECRFPVGEAWEIWKKEGVVYIENGRTKQKMPHYFQFYTSFVEQKERLSISRATTEIQVQHLIVHGIDDPTVSVTEAQKLHVWNPKSELFLVENTDHVFGTKHPWEKGILPQALQKIIKKTIQFANL